MANVNVVNVKLITLLNIFAEKMHEIQYEGKAHVVETCLGQILYIQKQNKNKTKISRFSVN